MASTASDSTVAGSSTDTSDTEGTARLAQSADAKMATTIPSGSSDADGDRDPSWGRFGERGHRHRQRHRVAQEGADRGRHHCRLPGGEREGHARGQRIAISEMFGHPEAGGTRQFGLARGVERILEGGEAVEADADTH